MEEKIIYIYFFLRPQKIIYIFFSETTKYIYIYIFQRRRRFFSEIGWIIMIFALKIIFWVLKTCKKAQNFRACGASVLYNACSVIGLEYFWVSYFFGCQKKNYIYNFYFLWRSSRKSEKNYIYNFYFT